jgi:ribosomal 30S subunit maturation factor RimM
MRYEDLIPVAKLGKNIDENGYIEVKKYNAFDEDLTELDFVFLLFKDYSVRYVKIADIKQTEGKLRIKFADQDDRVDISTASKVQLAVESNFIKATNPHSYIGMRVIVGDEIVGEVIDLLDNTQYLVFLVKDTEGHEFMIPNVGYFVLAENRDDNVLYVHNIGELKEL